MSAPHHCRRMHAISTPNGLASDAPFMLKPSSKLSLRKRRCSAELTLDVEGRGRPAITAVALLAAATVMVVLLRWLP